MIMNRTSWQVKDSAILDDLMALMHVTPEEQTLLAELSEYVQAQALPLTQAFYERLLKHPNTAEFLQDIPTERLHSMAAQWFTDLFQGVYDENYVQKRLVIGQIHVKIGLPVRYPLAMLDVIGMFGDAIATQSRDPEQATRAFRKLLALDVAIFNQAYEDDKLKHLTNILGNERLARSTLME